MERNTDHELYSLSVKAGANAASGDRDPTGGISSYPLTRKLDVGAEMLSTLPLSLAQIYE